MMESFVKSESDGVQTPQSTSSRSHAIFLSAETDDLQALSLVFDLPLLSYVDIGAEERVTQLMQRWPLLQELASQNKK